MRIYSEFERKGMLRFQSQKDLLLRPLTNSLLKLNIPANAVSILSGIVAVVSLCSSVLLNAPLLFILGIWLHLFLDGLDGSLARSTKGPATAGGLMMDIVFDSVGILTVGLYALYFGYVSVFTALFFIAVYLTVNAISYALAKTSDAYDFVIRPRVFVVIAITLDYTFAYHTTPILFGVSNIILAVFLFIGIRKLYRV